MSASYVTVGWNRQKKIYDWLIAFFCTTYLFLFIVFTVIFNNQVTFETLLIRSTSTLAILLLHVILAIGPLCRLNKKFLPLLYNRRHLGVTMFLLALVHGLFWRICQTCAEGFDCTCISRHNCCNDLVYSTEKILDVQFWVRQGDAGDGNLSIIPGSRNPGDSPGWRSRP